MIRARIPLLPIHADDVGQQSDELKVLILPNTGAMSDSQVAAVRRFAERGGGVVATGETSLFDEWGDRRSDFALADVFGARHSGRQHGSTGRALTRTEDHTYLRLHPDVGRDVFGPSSGHEPAITGKRHPVLEGFEETDIIAFGGLLQEVTPDDKAVVPMTFVPHSPTHPPETSWMRTPRTDIAALVLHEQAAGRGRVAYLPGDVDRSFGRDNLPDQGNLLANLIRWTAADSIPLRVEGSGLLDCHLYHQPGRFVLHVLNLTSAGSWRSPLHESVRIGPFKVSVEVKGANATAVHLLVSGETRPVAVRDGWATFEIKSIRDHEVVVIS